MKHSFLILIAVSLSFSAFSQNQIRVRGGFTSTITSVSEYDRGVGYFYYDSVTLDNRVVFPSVNVDVDIDLGKNWFLTNGLSYMRKGIESINYENGGYWLEARQEYIGMNVMLKYHHKFRMRNLASMQLRVFGQILLLVGQISLRLPMESGKNTFMLLAHLLLRSLRYQLPSEHPINLVLAK
jgi:hypothetical protein